MNTVKQVESSLLNSKPLANFFDDKLCNKKINYIVYLVSIYITCKILIFTLGDKTILISNYHIATGSIFIPLWFFIGDLLTELYGFNFVKRILILALFCQIFFALACYTTTLMPIASTDTINNSYDLIFKQMPRLAFSSLLALIFGALINSYLLNKWKNIVNGKYFLLRILSTTIFCEIIFSVVAIYSQFLGKTSFANILEILSASVTIKLTVSIIIAYPISVIANFIKYDCEPIGETTIAKLPHPYDIIKK